MELLNVDEAVMLYAEVLLTGDLCPPVIGQIALDVMTDDPPRPGEPSYGLYTQVRDKTTEARFCHEINRCFNLAILSYISQLCIVFIVYILQFAFAFFRKSV